MSVGFRAIERHFGTYVTPREKRRIKMEMLFWRLIKFAMYVLVFATLVQVIGEFSGKLYAAVGIISAVVIWDLTRFRL